MERLAAVAEVVLAMDLEPADGGAQREHVAIVRRAQADARPAGQGGGRGRGGWKPGAVHGHRAAFDSGPVWRRQITKRSLKVQASLAAAGGLAGAPAMH